MLTASIALGVLALALAWPVPLLLARAAWPSRAPALALLLWQAIALAGGLSMIGALLTYGLIPFGDSLLSSVGGFVDYVFHTPGAPAVGFGYVFALCAAVLLGGHLILNLIFTIVSTERQRRRHRQLVELLGAPMPDRPHTRLIDNAAPIAYCLPGALRSITVFSDGLVELLTPEQLDAVIGHETAHVTQRHDLLLVAFRAWHTSLPWFPIAYRAEREVGTLVEMLADDRALRTTDNGTLATAIALVASAPSDELEGAAAASGVPSATPRQVRARIARLGEGAMSVRPLARVVVVASAIALIGVPTALLLAPALVA